MSEIGKILLEYGLSGAVILGVIYLMARYVPKIIDIYIERMQKKDYRDDLLMNALANNTKVIENNNIITKAYTDNANVLGDKFDTLIVDFKRHDGRAEDMAQDLKVLKHTKK